MPRRSRKRRSQGESAGAKSKQSKEPTENVFTVIPKQSKKKKKPGQLTAQQLRQYFEEVSETDGFFFPENFHIVDNYQKVTQKNKTKQKQKQKPPRTTTTLVFVKGKSFFCHPYFLLKISLIKTTKHTLVY